MSEWSAAGAVASESTQTISNAQSKDYQEEEEHYVIIKGKIGNLTHGHKVYTQY